MNAARSLARPVESTRRPEPTSARVRRDLPARTAAAEADPDNQSKMRDHADALLNAAECGSCVFRDPLDKTCRAWPPRPLSDGRPVWPAVAESDWCSNWSAS